MCCAYNPALPCCMRILHYLSNRGSPRILEWVAYPFLQGILPKEESTWGLLHCSQIIYQLSYEGSPYMPYQFSSVQSLSPVQLFVTPWAVACQASLSITNSQSLLKLMSIGDGDAIQPSHPLSSPSPPAPNPSQHQSLFQ